MEEQLYDKKEFEIVGVNFEKMSFDLRMKGADIFYDIPCEYCELITKPNEI